MHPWCVEESTCKREGNPANPPNQAFLGLHSGAPLAEDTGAAAHVARDAADYLHGSIPGALRTTQASARGIQRIPQTKRSLGVREATHAKHTQGTRQNLAALAEVEQQHMLHGLPLITHTEAFLVR